MKYRTEMQTLRCGLLFCVKQSSTSRLTKRRELKTLYSALSWFPLFSASCWHLLCFLCPVFPLDKPVPNTKYCVPLGLVSGGFLCLEYPSQAQLTGQPISQWNFSTIFFSAHLHSCVLFLTLIHISVAVLISCFHCCDMKAYELLMGSRRY